MNDLPPPLTPPDCDLSSLPWFPLHYRRLRKSGFWLHSSAEVRALSVELWCASYEEIPAASLPDDDMALSIAAGFGRFQIEEWQAIKPNVMKAWLKCLDGRWYHPFLSVIALEAFIQKLKERARRPGAAAERAKTRLSEVGVMLAKLKNPEEEKGLSAEEFKLSVEEDGSSDGKSENSDVTGQDRTGHSGFASAKPVVPAFGEKFWMTYPHPKNRGDKRGTVAKLNKLGLDEQANAFRALEYLPGIIEHECKRNPQYSPPMASTFVNQQRWEAIIEEADQKSATATKLVLPDNPEEREIAEALMRRVGKSAFVSYFSPPPRKNGTGWIINAGPTKATLIDNRYNTALNDIIGKGNWKFKEED